MGRTLDMVEKVCEPRYLRIVYGCMMGEILTCMAACMYVCMSVCRSYVYMYMYVCKCIRYR